MTWTYSGDPSSTERDAVRFHIGDVDTNDQQLNDAEIAYLLTLNDEPLGAAILAARALAGKYSRQVGSSIESLRLFAADRFKHYKELAALLEKQYEESSAGGLGTPLIAGISNSEITSVESDTDRVRSAFKKGQFDNPQFGSQSDPLND